MKAIRNRLMALLLIALCGCSNADTGPRYQNLATGKGNPKAAGILAAASAAFEDLKSERWPELYNRMTSEARAELPRARFVSQCELVTSRFGVPIEMDILEVHVATVPQKPANVPDMVMMGTEGQSYILPNPIYLASPVSGPVAFILGKATSRGPSLKSWVTLVLQRVNDQWGLVAFHMSACEANGHDGTWFKRQAEEFRKKGMRRVAFLYENFGAQLLLPSPYIVVPSSSEQMRRSLNTEAAPNLPLPGVRPSENWTMDDGTQFAIESVSIVGAPSFLSLDISYKTKQTDPESSQAQAERENLHGYVLSNFPEYKEAFDGIYISSVTQCGKGFRTYFAFSQKLNISAD